jgi:hypothetical protein
MRGSSAALVSLLLAAACVTPAGIPPQRQSSLAARIERLDRSTPWRLAEEIPVGFDTHHPQGMVRIGGDFFVTSVEIIRPTARFPAPVNGMDRDEGEGAGHLFRIGPDGALKASLSLGEGAIYHPGGPDFDGRHLWIPVAEYRPDSRSIIYRIDPKTLVATEMFRVSDHIGAVAYDAAARALIAVSWGARRIYRWPLRSDGTVAPADLAAPPAGLAHTHYIAWQDCHGAGVARMLCTGLSSYAGPASVSAASRAFSLGGAELIDLTDLRPVWAGPIPLWSPAGRPMTQNPAWFEATAIGLRAWFMPDDDLSTLFVYEATIP